MTGGIQRDKYFFTLIYNNDFARDKIAFKTQPQRQKKGRLSETKAMVTVMTIRKFWIGFTFYLAFFAVMVLCAFTFGQASTFDSSDYSEEELFVLDIRTLPAWNEAPFFALMPQQSYESFGDLIQRGQPNLVIRASFTERSSCRVYDPFGQYTTADLHKVSPGAKMSAAALYICTPYDVKIEEVLLGDSEQFKEGDHFTFYAPYGIVGENAIRYDDTPIFSAGREYLLFFSVMDVEGVGRWYDLTHPSSAGEIMIEDERTFSSMSYAGNDLFEDTMFDCETLTEELWELYAENPYPLTIPSLTPVNSWK